MKKIAIIGSLVALTVLASAVPPQTKAVAADAVSLSLEGSPMQFAVQPRLQNGSLFVPLRNLTEALGAQVDWEAASATASVVKGDVRLTFTVGNETAFRNGVPVTLGAAPVMEQGQMLVPLRLIGESLAYNVYWDGANKSVDIRDAAGSLPTVGSADNLKQLLKDASQTMGPYGGGIAVIDQAGITADGLVMKTMAAVPQGAAMESSASAPSAARGAAGAAASGGAAAPDFSKTNVQEEGVDEADVIKTDGSYIYQVNRNRIVIAQAYPADTMSIVSTLPFTGDNFTPNEMYVDGNQLIVIGRSSVADSVYDAPAPAPAQSSSAVSAPAAAKSKIVILPARSRTTTKALVYDTTDKTNLRKVREIELEGGYVSSRKIGSSLYLVANKSINMYRILNGGPAVKSAAGSAEEAPPVYRDSLAGDSYIQIGYEDIRYFPQSPEPNYLLVAGVDLSKPDQKASVQTYLGSGQNVYASDKNLYVTMQKYERTPSDNSANSSNGSADASLLPAPVQPLNINSDIYKFGLDRGTVRYAGKGTVPGRVLNQFSMDEQDGYFRIATTTGEEWRQDGNTSQNNLYVLDESLAVKGKLEHIAPGEKIYSVRYTGNRAYMVTFRTVDPLFVIDLSNPQSPAILGQLKIPGYSDYLHPYDDNHIIGFGKDAEVVSTSYGQSGAPAPMAYYQGMKVALFDVTDVTKPTELFNASIGDRGTDSELLRNHKALLFSKERNLLAFPVTVMEVPNKPASPTPKDVMQYGQFAFQGAYVYRLDLQNGFQLRGAITHMSSEDTAKAGYNGYNYEHSVQRILYIGDTLYTSSLGTLKANELSTLRELKSVDIPK